VHAQATMSGPVWDARTSNDSWVVLHFSFQV
jgi:hypothetical protein